MRIECPSCHELHEAQLIRVAGHSATFACAACGEEASSEVARSQSTEDLAEVEAELAAKDGCPKCDRPMPADNSHCPNCGLSKEKFADFNAPEGPNAPELSAAWKQVEANWDEDSAHEVFAAEVALRGDFRLGAIWYRQAAANDAQAGKAEQMLDRIQSMATAALLSAKPKLAEEKEPFKGVVILLIVMVVLAAGLGFVLMNKNTAQPSPENSSVYPSSKYPTKRVK